MGPHSYERLRAALLDALARIVHKLGEDRPPKQVRPRASEAKRPKRKRKVKRKIKSATA